MRTKTKGFYGSLAVLALIALLLASGLHQHLSSTSPTGSHSEKKAKYVFLFIGDGMSMPQINAAEIYKGIAENSTPAAKGRLSLASLPYQGIQTTHSANSFITESSAAATALATGHKTNNGVLGMDPAQTSKYASIAEMAKAKGMKTGIISTVFLNDATPAAFYAHEPSRKNYYEIALSLFDSGFDYFAGGGLRSDTHPQKQLPELLAIANQTGYKFVNTTESILNLNPTDGKIIAICPELAAGKSMPYEIDRNSQPSLRDFTRKAIEVLDNSSGFFMMVEGGKIDWACHANDAGTMVREVLALDDAVAEAIEFYKKHPDETLIVITGDHETGGLTIGSAGTGYETNFNTLKNQFVSLEKLETEINLYRGNVAPGNAALADWLPFLTQQMGLADLSSTEINRLETAFAASMTDPKNRSLEQKSQRLYGSYDPFSITVIHILSEKAGVGWTTYAHTGLSVPVFAQGTGGSLFQGSYDNTDVAKKIMRIMGLD